MPTFRTTRRVRHAADEMFDLVADVEHYPEFLPLCQSLRVRRRSELDDGREQLIADMRIGYKAIRETFVSRVTLDRAKREILVEYIDGPFRHLENRWVFAPTASGDGPPACAVDFYLDYEFRSRLFATLMGSVFDAAFRRFAEAFEQRANSVYARDAGLRLV